MKTPILLCGFLILFTINTNGWVAFERANLRFSKDNNETYYCYETNLKLGWMARNETKRAKNQCVTAKCEDDWSVYYSGCPLVLVGDRSCKLLPGNISLPYPDCCFKILCNGKKSTSSKTTENPVTSPPLQKI